MGSNMSSVMKLADKIDNVIVELEQLFSDAMREFARDDLPEEWADDLSDADERAQEAQNAIGQASDFSEHVDALQGMLRRIDKHDDEDAAT